uniref:Uncharacterized protein n=1 Tax=Glossina brevipalpis TaxID=37001 RepID=A0A1A9W9Y2_9MUSC
MIGLSNRNLLGEDCMDCSFIFLYILCTMFIRQNIQQLLGFALSRAASKHGGGYQNRRNLNNQPNVGVARGKTAGFPSSINVESSKPLKTCQLFADILKAVIVLLLLLATSIVCL